MSLQSDADRTFLGLLLWRECRGEKREGKEAVAHSVVNRVKNPAWGDTIQHVAFQRLQYSSLTHHLDPQLTVWPLPDDTSWRECLVIADLVLTGGLISNVGDADSYYDDSIKPPAWATPKNFVTKIGRLNFHKTGR